MSCFCPEGDDCRQLDKSLNLNSDANYAFKDKFNTYTYGDGWRKDMDRVRHGWSLPWQWDCAEAISSGLGLALGSPWPGGAGGSWRPVVLLHNWSRVRGASSLECWANGQHGWAWGVRAWLLRLVKDLRKSMSLYSPLTENTCFNALEARAFCVCVFKDCNGKVGLVIMMNLCNRSAHQPLHHFNRNKGMKWLMWEGTSGWPWIQSVCLHRKTQSQLSRHPILDRKF